MKLKTLKDFEEEHEKWTCEDSLVTGDELKEEAIKWIKHYRELNKKTEVINEQGANYLIQEWIKHFFNIEEKDLE